MLRLIPRDYLPVAVEEVDGDIGVLSGALVAVHRRLAPHSAAYQDGLIPMVLELLRLIGDVQLSDELTECRVERKSHNDDRISSRSYTTSTAWHSVPWVCNLNCDINRMESKLLETYSLSQKGQQG